MTAGKDCLLLRERGRLAIAHASDVADEAALLVGDAHLDGRYLMMVADADGLGTKQVALLGTRDKQDVVADADGELTLTIQQGSNGQVGQRKQGTSLTDIGTIEVLFGNHHFGHSMGCVHFRNPAAGIGCKAIRTIE